MLRLHTPAPHTLASRWVQLVWEWDSYRSPTPTERILPHGMIELAWNLDTGHRFRDASHDAHIHGPALLGARSAPYVVSTAAPARLFGVVFQPGAAADLFGVSAAELAGGFFALDDLPQGAALHDRLTEARTPQDRLDAALGFFNRRTTPPDNAEARFLLNAWSDADGRQRSVGSLRGALGVSAPTLVHRVRRQLGLRPAQLRQLLMFKAAVELLAARTTPLAHAALDAGYCDQSHLNRAFRHHADLTPRQFNPLDPAHPFNLAIP